MQGQEDMPFKFLSTRAPPRTLHSPKHCPQGLVGTRETWLTFKPSCATRHRNSQMLLKLESFYRVGVRRFIFLSEISPLTKKIHAALLQSSRLLKTVCYGTQWSVSRLHPMLTTSHSRWNLKEEKKALPTVTKNCLPSELGKAATGFLLSKLLGQFNTHNVSFMLLNW